MVKNMHEPAFPDPEGSVFGGLSKLELLTALIATGLPHTHKDVMDSATVERATRMAVMILGKD